VPGRVCAGDPQARQPDGKARHPADSRPLAVGISAHCDGCVAYDVHDALAAGASRGEIIETIGVAIMMSGGPALVYGCEAREAIDQFHAASPR
jgi:AhpD family alkylhydroperoxidase